MVDVPSRQNQIEQETADRVCPRWVERRGGCYFQKEIQHFREELVGRW